MTANIRGPRVLKGALVSVENGSMSGTVIPFQYNPNTVKRSLKPSMAGGESGDRSQIVRITGAPPETISLEIELDAADALDRGDSTAEAVGLYPQLAMLELLVFPKSSHITSLQTQASAGVLEIAPFAAPRLLFVWGNQRVQPVQIESYSISEEEFDASLNPIRATVSLELRVLSYSDLSSSNADYHQYLSYQQNLEALAQRAGTVPMTSLGNVSISAAPDSAADMAVDGVDSIASIANSIL